MRGVMLESSNDEDLVQQAQQGNLGAFSTLINRYSNTVYATAFSILGDYHLAQDIAQESFIKAWFAIHHLKEAGKFGGWVYSIARRKSIDWLRKNKQKLLPIENLGHIPDPFSLDDYLLQEEQRILVRKALSMLDEKNRIVVLLYYMSGLKAREIGRFLDLSLSAVESRLRRSKQLLQKELAEMVEKTLQENKLQGDFAPRVVQKIMAGPKILIVSNKIQSEKYYVDVLGFATDGCGELHRDELKFLLDEGPVPLPEVAWHYYAYTKDGNDLDALYEEFRTRGAIFAIEARMISNTWKEFIVQDLDGHKIAFGANIK